uniref:PB1 domain-containing protein n=1 Tax=Acrobeloides nanus TaxID=290746 RepID=A0A914C843_9BILA
MSSRDRSRMGIFSDTRIQWTHFGKKHKLNFSKEEMDYMDLYDVMMRKILEILDGAFDGVIAYNDPTGRQTIIRNDSDLRTAIHQLRGKLKVYTTIPPERGYMAASDIARAPRSQSVPPMNSRYSPVNDPRSPSSLDANYRTYDRHSARTNGYHDRPQHDAYSRSNSFDRRQQTRSPYVNSPPPHSNSPPNTNGRVQTYQTNAPPNVPPGYSYTYTSVGPTPYTQPLLYGMPPQNLLLSHFLSAGHFPGLFYRGAFIGPNKYHNFGYPNSYYYKKVMDIL